MSEQRDNSRDSSHSVDDRQLEAVSAGRRRSQSLEAAGLEVVVAAATTD